MARRLMMMQRHYTYGKNNKRNTAQQGVLAGLSRLHFRPLSFMLISLNVQVRAGKRASRLNATLDAKRNNLTVCTCVHTFSS